MFRLVFIDDNPGYALYLLNMVYVKLDWKHVWVRTGCVAVY